MSETRTMVRTEVSINGRSSYLAQGQDLDELKRRMEAAIDTSGTFVDFVVVGNRTVSVLISPQAHVVFSVETVQFDSRDTGDHDDPYGGPYDF